MKERLSGILGRIRRKPERSNGVSGGNRKKVILIVAIIAAIVAACAFGATHIYNRFHGGTINVYSFSEVGLDPMMVEDDAEIEGSVSTDQLQTEYLSESQTVDEVYVKKGQKVKEGDKLFAYDTTLSKLDLQRKDIAVQKKALELTQARKRLAIIRTYRAGVPIKDSVADSIGGSSVIGNDDEDEDDDGEDSGGMQTAAPAAITQVTNLANTASAKIVPLGGVDGPTDATENIPKEIANEKGEKGDGTENNPYIYEWKSGYYFDDTFIANITHAKRTAFVKFVVAGELPDELKQYREQYQELQDQLDELNEKLDALQQDKKTNEKDLNQLKSDIETIILTSDDPAALIDQLETLIANSDNAEELTEKLEAIKSVTDEMEDKLTEMQADSEELTKLRNQITQMILTSDDAAALIDQLKTLIADSENAEELQQRLQELQQNYTVSAEQIPDEGDSEATVDSSENNETPEDASDSEVEIDADEVNPQSTAGVSAQVVPLMTIKTLGGDSDTIDDAVVDRVDDPKYTASWTMEFQWVNNSYRYIILSIEIDGVVYKISAPLPKVPEPDEPIDDDPGDDGELPDGDGGGSADGIIYTRAQLAELIAQAELDVKNLERQLRKLQIEYEKQKLEVDEDTVYAKVTGVVTTLRDPKKVGTERAFLKVSGNGAGYTISGTVSELELNRATKGAAVTVTNEEIGEAYPGTVESVKTYPTTSSYWDSAMNNNVSYYPFTVKVSDDAEFNLDDYITISFDKTAEESASVYLMKPFVRSEDGKSYIYVAGEDGALEKRYVTTGKDVWGYYIEIKSGMTEGDMVAFPYGQHVREGAPTVEASIDALYNE